MLYIASACERRQFVRDIFSQQMAVLHFSATSTQKTVHAQMSL